MKNIISLIFIGLLLMSVSCKKDKNKEDDDQIIVNNSANNNSAILIGDTIGDGSQTIDSLRKIGKVIVENGSNDFYTDTIYFISSGYSTSEYTYWIMPIRNISENAHAFIEATDFTFLDSNNNILSQGPDNCAFVNGSCGTGTLSNVMTNTFLRPNELGYFVGIEDVNFDKVAKIKIKSIKHQNFDFYYSNVNVIPTSYSAPNHTYHHKVNLNIKNESNEAVYVRTSSYLLLDQNNKPLQYSFFNFEQLVSSNSSTSMVDKYSFYFGRCNKIQPFLNLSLSMELKSISSKSSYKNIDERNKDLILQRDNRIKKELQTYTD